MTMTTAATITVGQHDVLLGRDKAQHRHPGNKRFRDLVREFRVEYQQSLLREDKKRIAETIISIVNANGGRFLKHGDGDGHGSRWSEVSEIDRYKKVCHALRSAKGRRSPTTVANSKNTSRQLSPGSLFTITTSQEEQRQHGEWGEEATHPRMHREVQNVEVESAAVVTLKGIQAAAPSVAAATLSAVPTDATASFNGGQDLFSQQQKILQNLLDNVDIRTVFDDDGANDVLSVIKADDQSVFRDDDMPHVFGDYFFSR